MLTPAQVDAINIAEKVTSFLSILGSIFVVATFLLNSHFRKAINRLVFFATFGNLICNVATLIGISAIGYGEDSSICQIQAALIQWFMAADSLWMLSMAYNVYLSFFHNYNAEKLRYIEWRYFLFCYGIPLIPTFVYIFFRIPGNTIYGDATLWCWISAKYEYLRIATFYAPIWVVMLTILTIYIRVGTRIRVWRRNIIAQSRLSGRSSAYISHLRHSYKRSKSTAASSSTRMTATTQDLKYQASMLQHNLTEVTGPAEERALRAIEATLHYYKCASLFFVALLVTWVPSTINRMYTLHHPDAPSFPLLLTAAIVLPLQGFWNAMIYITTSGKACRALWSEVHDLFNWKTWIPGHVRRSNGISWPLSNGTRNRPVSSIVIGGTNHHQIIENVSENDLVPLRPGNAHIV